MIDKRKYPRFRLQVKAKYKILKFIEKVNYNGQSLIEVLQELEDDLSITDDMWLQFVFEYDFNSKGEIIDKRLQELLRVSPLNMGLIMRSIPSMF